MPLFRDLFHKWTGYDEVRWLEHSSPTQTPDRFLLRSAEHFGVRAQYIGPALAPVQGTVFRCTHHTGAVDILALYPILRNFAGQLKIVVNEKLMALKVLNDIFIPVW